MRKIFLDIETKNTFQEVKSSDPTALDISLLVIYDSKNEEYLSFTPEEFTKLWPIIEHTDIIIGYNSDYFDIPLLNKYYPGDLTKIKSIDLMQEIKKFAGKRIPLDAVAAGTLGINKGGKGLDAVLWYRQGEIEKIRTYCQQDVKITKELYEFANEYKFLRYKFFNDTTQIPIDTSNWDKLEKTSINLTMPW